MGRRLPSEWTGRIADLYSLHKKSAGAVRIPGVGPGVAESSPANRRSDEVMEPVQEDDLTLASNQEDGIDVLPELAQIEDVDNKLHAFLELEVRVAYKEIRIPPCRGPVAHKLREHAKEHVQRAWSEGGGQSIGHVGIVQSFCTR